MKITISADLPLQISQTSLVWKEGALQSPSEWTFPEYKVWMHEQNAFLPIAQDAQGVLYTDSNWELVSQFVEQLSKKNENCSAFLYRKMRAILNEWNVSCPSLKNYQTPFGCLMKIASDPYQSSGEVETLLQEFKKKWNNLSLDELSAFKDLGRNALDLTFLHQNWELAELCWKKGLRFSDDALVRGDILATFVVQKREFLSNSKFATTPALVKEQWIQTWQDRFEELGMWEKIAQYSTQYKYQDCKDRGFLGADIAPFQENALAFYLQTVCRGTSKSLKDEDLKEEQIWIRPLRSTTGWEDLRVFSMFDFTSLTDALGEMAPKLEKIKAWVDRQSLDTAVPYPTHSSKPYRL